MDYVTWIAFGGMCIAWLGVSFACRQAGAAQKTADIAKEQLVEVRQQAEAARRSADTAEAELVEVRRQLATLRFQLYLDFLEEADKVWAQVGAPEALQDLPPMTGVDVMVLRLEHRLSLAGSVLFQNEEALLVLGPPRRIPTEEELGDLFLKAERGLPSASDEDLDERPDEPETGED